MRHMKVEENNWDYESLHSKEWFAYDEDDIDEEEMRLDLEYTKFKNYTKDQLIKRVIDHEITYGEMYSRLESKKNELTLLRRENRELQAEVDRLTTQVVVEKSGRRIHINIDLLASNREEELMIRTLLGGRK